MPTSYRADTPFSTVILGIPITTLTATLASFLLYLVALVVLLSVKCPLQVERVAVLFTFLLIALLAVLLMALANMLYTRYRFNCLSLTLSLLYSGSAALIFFCLIMSFKNGLCRPEVPGNLFQSDKFGGISIWVLTLFGLLFQVVAHYYYG